MAHQGRSAGSMRGKMSYAGSKKGVARKPGAKRTMSSYKAKAKSSVARKPGAKRNPGVARKPARGRMSYRSR